MPKTVEQSMLSSVCNVLSTLIDQIYQQGRSSREDTLNIGSQDLHDFETITVHKNNVYAI